MILDKAIIGICKIASKESVRPALSSVQLKDGKATATDGYKLITIPLLPEEGEDAPDMGYTLLHGDSHLLKADELEKALKLVPTKASLPILTKAWTAKGDYDNTVKILSTDLNTKNASELTETQADFPNTQKVLDDLNEKEVKATLRIDARYLKEMLDAMLKAGLQNNYSKYVDIEIRGEFDPLKLTAEVGKDRKIEAIIMPVRK